MEGKVRAPLRAPAAPIARRAALGPDEAQTARRRWLPLVGMEGTFAPGREAPSAFSTRRYPDSELLEWVIVGGGIQGTYFSHLLIRRFGLSHRSIRVIDPYDEPLHRWKRFADNVGMTMLRSPAVHHLDLASLSLKRFAPSARLRQSADVRGERVLSFLAPYGRPSLQLFNRHAEEVIQRNGLGGIRIRGLACGLRLIDGGFEVCYVSDAAPETTLASRRIILAIGMSDQPCWPQWALSLRAAGAPVFHILDPDFSRRRMGDFREAIVYGGGLSAAQVALALAKQRPGRVTLATRHDFRVHLFDSEPSWQGQNFMRSFAHEPDPSKRREIITRERHRGSLTPEAREELDAAVAGGIVRLVRIEEEPSPELGAQGELSFAVGGSRIRCDLMILATGYERKRPGGEWLDRAIGELGLPCAPCGFPIPDPSLQWRPGLYVSGPLAELELGPVARNIAGAHRAGARLEYHLLEKARG